MIGDPPEPPYAREWSDEERRDFTNHIFAVDYGKQLADTILRINWNYLDILEKTAKDDGVERGYASVSMMTIQQLWNSEIADTCRKMMEHMSQTVAEFQRLATDALATIPPRGITKK